MTLTRHVAELSHAIPLTNPLLRVADDVAEATRINTQREREQAAMCPLFLRGAPQWVVKKFQMGKDFMDRLKGTYA
jgi:hypothetical protein